MASTSTAPPAKVVAATPADGNTSERGSIISADDIDEGCYAESLTTSYETSIASEIRRGIAENGRIYPSYGRNMYGMPIDEQELDRSDMNHAKYLLLLHGQHHLAPIAATPQAILDLGTGTGIWAIEMADRYPSAQVTGIDVAPVQPTWVPPNCVFEVEDVEEEWTFRKDSYDFIHAREFLTAIRDWRKLARQSLDHLKPGGWLELSATIPDVSSDDGTIPVNSAYLEASRVFFDMSRKMGTPLEAPRAWKDIMQHLGFTSIHEVTYKLPMGPWAKDKRLKQIGAIERAALLDGFEAYMLRGYTQILGGDPNVLQILLAQARREISDRTIHTHVFFHVVYGKKPELPRAD